MTKIPSVVSTSRTTTVTDLSPEINANISNSRCPIPPFGDFAAPRGTVTEPAATAYNTAVMNSNPTVFWRYPENLTITDLFGGKFLFFGTDPPQAKPPLNTWAGASQRHRSDLGDTWEAVDHFFPDNTSSAPAQTWVNQVGQWAIWEYDYMSGLSQAKYQYAYPATTGVNIATVDCYKNVYVVYQFDSNPAFGGIGGPDYYANVGPIFRWTNSSNYWRATIKGANAGGGPAGTFEVVKVQAGVETVMYSEDLSAGPYAPPTFGGVVFSIRVVCFGSRIYVYSPNIFSGEVRPLSGDPGVATITDSFNANATHCGMYSDRAGNAIGNPPWSQAGFYAAPVGVPDSSGNGNEGEIWGGYLFPYGHVTNDDYRQEGTGFSDENSFQWEPANNLSREAWSSLEACYIRSDVAVTAPFTMESIVFLKEEESIIMSSGKTRGIAIGQGGTPGLTSEFENNNINPTSDITGGFGPEIIIVILDGTKPVKQFPTGVYVPTHVVHLALTYDGTTVKAYVDGKLVYNATHAGVTSSGGFTVGGAVDEFGKIYISECQVDETALYHHVLSESAIQAHVAAAYRTVDGVGPLECYGQNLLAFRSGDTDSPFYGFTSATYPFVGSNYGIVLRYNRNGNGKRYLTLYQLRADGTIKTSFGTIDFSSSGWSNSTSRQNWASLSHRTIVGHIGSGTFVAIDRNNETLTFDTFDSSITTTGGFFASRVQCFRLDETHFFAQVTTPFTAQKDWAMFEVRGTTITEIATGAFPDFDPPVYFNSQIPDLWFATPTHLIGDFFAWNAVGDSGRTSLVAIPYSVTGTLGTPVTHALPVLTDPGGNVLSGTWAFFERFVNGDFLIGQSNYDPPGSFDSPIDLHIWPCTWDGTTFTIGPETDTNWTTSFSSSEPWCIGEDSGPFIGGNGCDNGPTPGNTHIFFGYASLGDTQPLCWQEWTQDGTTLTKNTDWVAIPGTYGDSGGTSGAICMNRNGLIIPYTTPWEGFADLIALAFDGSSSSDVGTGNASDVKLTTIDALAPIRLSRQSVTSSPAGDVGENDPFFPTELRTIYVTPYQVTEGDTATMEGWGWIPGQVIGDEATDVTYGSINAISPGYVTIVPNGGPVTVDANGHFSFTFTIPTDDGNGNRMVGYQRITVTLLDTRQAYATYIRAGCFVIVQPA